MRNYQLVLLYLFAFTATATVFKVPVQRNYEALIAHLNHLNLHSQARTYDEVSKFHENYKRAQIPLHGADDFSTADRHRVEVWDGSFFTPYIVPAAIGNPPQPFRLLLDLAWDTLFVPSADCTGDCARDGVEHLHFFANQSSTYSELYPSAVLSYSTDRFVGCLGQDTFRIAGLEVVNQSFVNADSADPIGYLSFYFGYDGVLGLAPRWDYYESPPPDRDSDDAGSSTATWAPSPWTNMVTHSVLDTNLFALDLPSGVWDVQRPARTGEISFGAIHPRYESSVFTALPLSNYTDQAWAIEAQGMTWSHPTHPLYETFENRTLAGFDSTAWFLGVPGNWSRAIYSTVNHTCDQIVCWVECDARAGMPDLTFTIGRGDNITLSALEYTTEMVLPGNETKCMFALYNSQDWYPIDAIVFGKPFLETFYSVFDLDEMEVRLTRRID